MIVSGSRRWLLIVALVLIAAGLRFYHLGTWPLRGDEAFTIRYWAASPAEVLSSGLPWIEPHPFGALFSFGVWRTLVGDSEISMRLLPALLNLLGVPVLYNLGRRLCCDDRVGYAAALLWAVNPLQIWHAQDVRNYAIWSALSVLAMWLLIRAADRRQRIDWLLYIIAEAAALYIFFFQICFVLVGALYVFVWRRTAWRGWLRALIILGVLLIPWLGQAWALAHSGYKGTAGGANLAELWTRFLPAQFVGEANAVFAELWSTILVLLSLSLLIFWRRGRQSTALFLIVYACLPALLLTIAATRMNVFLPRYLIAAAPALLLITAYGVVSLHRWISFYHPAIAWGGVVLLAGLFVALPLLDYWHSGYRKTQTDWFGLRDYLSAFVQPGDLVLLTTLDPDTGNIDPAFNYYFRNPVDAYSLPRTTDDSAAYIRSAAEHYRVVWFIPSGAYAGQIDKLLRENMQLISDRGAGEGQIVREYRSPELKPGEIEHPLMIYSGDLALRGYSIEQAARQLTVILFWQPGARTTDTVFVHLIGAPHPGTGSPLWSQDDHPPTQAARDVYTLNLTDVLPGDYTVQIGLYDPANLSQRREWSDASGKPIGESITLTHIVNH